MQYYALLTILLLVGCSGRELSPLNPCTINAFDVELAVDRIDKVDLLFVIDDSGSMAAEQDKLREQIPNLVSILASGAPPEGSGIPDFPAVRDLRVGVVSTNMGIGVPFLDNNRVNMGCAPVERGKDGLLQRGTEIAPGAPPYLEYGEGDSTSGFATSVGAIAELGTEGCGFEQQLEAALKAITPSSSEIQFLTGNGEPGPGHGGAPDANQGFVREDSLLAVVFLTDEDDCSASNIDVFHPSRSNSDVPLNQRCWRLGNEELGTDEFLYNERRYIDGLRAGRSDGRLVVAAITGIPESYNTRVDGSEFTPTDFVALLNDPAMLERPSPNESIEPVCGVPVEDGGDGVAYPARRIARTLQGLEAEGVGVAIQSICQDDFSNALSVIIRRIADALNATCLPRQLNRDSEGRVGCEVVEYLPPGEYESCAELASLGRVAVGTVDHDNDPMTPDRQGCRICQVSASGQLIDEDPACVELGVNAGWFYDEGAEVAARCPEGREQAVSFTAGAEPVNRAEMQLTCLQTASAGASEVTVGTGCGVDSSICQMNPTILGAPLPGGQTLSCDTQGSSTCQFECTNDADCESVGLGGSRCSDPDGEGPGFRYCVNPTCAG